MTFHMQTAVRTERPGHPMPTPWQLRQRLMRFLTIVIVVVVILSLVIVWQYQNQKAAERIVGSWYCVGEEIKYTFESDGKFSAGNGQQILLTGTWKAGWQSNNLLLIYEFEGQEIREETSYALADANSQLIFKDIQTKSLVMNRLKDS